MATDFYFFLLVSLPACVREPATKKCSLSIVIKNILLCPPHSKCSTNVSFSTFRHSFGKSRKTKSTTYPNHGVFVPHKWHGQQQVFDAYWSSGAGIPAFLRQCGSPSYRPQH